MNQKILLNKIKDNIDFTKKLEEYEAKKGNVSLESLNMQLDILNDKITNFSNKKDQDEITKLKTLESELKDYQLSKVKIQQNNNKFVSSISDKLINLNQKLSNLESNEKTLKTEETSVNAEIGDLLELSFGEKNFNVIRKVIKHSKEINFKIADFGTATKTVQMKDIKFPYKFKVVAFSEGTHNRRFYPWNVVKKAAPLIMDIEAVTYHVNKQGNDSILTSVGKITDFETNDQTKKLMAEIELFETTAGKDIALLHANRRLKDVSMQINEDDFPGDCQEITELRHIAFVREGGVADAKICYDGICQ